MGGKKADGVGEDCSFQLQSPMKRLFELEVEEEWRRRNVAMAASSASVMRTDHLASPDGRRKGGQFHIRASRRKCRHGSKKRERRRMTTHGKYF